MKRIIQVAAIVSVFVLGTSVGNACFVCSCFKPEIKDAFARAKVVFVGEVTEVVAPRSTDRSATFEDAAHTIKFKVETAWKGQFWTEISVLARMDGCYSLRTLPKKGERYLVYAEPVFRLDPSRSEVMTNSCTRTALLTEISTDGGFFYRNQALDDIRALDSMMIMLTLPRNPVLNLTRMNGVANN